MKDYFDIIKPVIPDFKKADEDLLNIVSAEKNDLSADLETFLTRGSKKIRSALVFLISRALGFNTSAKQIYIANAVELVHNASIMHDDVIDKAECRRKQKSFNSVYEIVF